MPLRGPSAPFQLLRAGFTFFARLLSTSGTYPRRMSATYAKPMRVNAGIAQSKASSFLPIYLLPRKPEAMPLSGNYCKPLKLPCSETQTSTASPTKPGFQVIKWPSAKRDFAPLVAASFSLFVIALNSKALSILWPDLY